MSKLPSKLLLFNLFLQGYGFGGEGKNAKLPSIKFLTEKFSGGGMAGSVNWRTGQVDDLKLEYTIGGLTVQGIRAMGATAIDGVQLRFVGAYQRPDTGDTAQAEVVVRGQQNEWDPGDVENGKDTEHKFTIDVVYYKLIVDGRDEIEIDILNGLVIIDGKNQFEKLRSLAGYA